MTTFPDAPKGANKRPAHCRCSAGRKGAYTYRRGRRAATAAGERVRLTHPSDAQWPETAADVAERRASHRRSGRGRALFARSPREWWDPRGKMARAAQVQSGAARLYPRPGGRAFRARRQAARLPRRACASSTSAAAAASCPSRWRGSARRWSAPIRPRPTSRRRSGTPAQSGLAIDYRATTAEELAEAGETLRRRAGDGGGRARRRRRRCSSRRCADDGEAGRADDRRHAQPHAEELCARHRRRRIRAALAAARHPSMGQVRHAERARDRAWSRPACDVIGETRRDLQSRSPTAGSSRPTWT